MKRLAAEAGEAEAWAGDSARIPVCEEAQGEQEGDEHRVREEHCSS